MSRTRYAVAAALAALVAGNTAAAQNSNDKASAGAAVTKSSPQYSESMDQLMRAAQRVREAIQALAQNEPGSKRDAALQSARQALHDAQQAMIQLPPDQRYAAAPPRGGVTPDYAASMKKLRQASDRLYDAMHAMAKQPAGERRNNAIGEAREALFETEQAMLALPNAVGATSSSGSGTTGGQGGKSDKGKTAAAPATIVLFPPLLVVDDKFSGGCWARLFADQNFAGDTLTISGPGDFAYLKTSYANFMRKWDSVAIGPKATLTAYNNENYTQPVATFKPGQKISDLDDKLGFFENVRSVRIACAK